MKERGRTEDMKLTMPALRPYQLEAARAILESVYNKKGMTFSIEIARQGGKNELSAQLEALLLGLRIRRPENIVKCSPTFKPQTVISMSRLIDRLNDAGLRKAWKMEMGYILKLGRAKAIFLSADKTSNVVGNTAHLLLEVDESQDVGKEKYGKEFKPMGASTNCTVVHYGTTWDDTTLLEEVKQTNLELEKKDGIKRHFRYDWQEVAEYNQDYLNYVEAERQRLGEDHPLFLTQYKLLPIHGGGGLLSPLQITKLRGPHSRKKQAEEGKYYVAGIDLGGEEEGNSQFSISNFKSNSNYLNSNDKNRGYGRDSTVVTIGELDYGNNNQDTRYNNQTNSNYQLTKQPKILIVEQYRWTGRPHTEIYGQLVDILKNVWRCRKVVVDATGLGEPVASFLKQALGHKIVPFKFSETAKSELGFNLLAAINAGRLKMYAGDGSPEYKEFFFEMEKAKSHYRPNKTMNFYVEPAFGHDIF